MNKIIEDDILNVINSNIVDWELFRNKTVLVSGANGMLPSYMVYTFLILNKLRSYNIHILALVRNKKKGEEVFKDFSSKDGLEFIVQDVAKHIHYDGDIHYIVHAASQAAPSYYGTDPVGTFKANTLGTLNMLELAREKKVKSFLFFSTGAIYGDVPGENILHQEDKQGILNTLDIRNCYGESKRAGENACACYHYQYGVPTKIVRIFHTFGPNVNLNDGRVFSDFCKNIVNNENIILKSDGSAKRCFCYVADAIQAYFLILLKGVPANAYNVGGDEDHEISVRDLSELLVSLYAGKNLHVIYDIDKNDITYTKMQTPQKRILPCLNKIKALGWNQTTDIASCFQRTIEALSIK